MIPAISASTIITNKRYKLNIPKPKNVQSYQNKLFPRKRKNIFDQQSSILLY